MSLSASTLKDVRCRVVLAAGRTKTDAIKRIKDGEVLPINTLGDINWYLDEKAAFIK